MNAAGLRTEWMPAAPRAAKPRRLDWAEAQAVANFVLFRPDPLPDGLRVVSTTFRPETAPRAGPARPPWTIPNRATHRCEIAGPGLRIRIKQFLYDWAPPAWDHPSLAGCKARPFVLGGHVGWLGIDFRGCHAATACIDRTTVEVAVREGQCGDDVLVAIFHALRPVAEEARGRILATPFAQLAYASRHEERAAAVPVGYWRHRRGPGEIPVEAHVREGPHDLPGRHLTTLPPRVGVRLDSVFVFGDREEVEYLFEDRSDPGRTLRLLVSPSGARYGVPWPPGLEGQPCDAERLEIGGREVRYAYGDPRFGPHEATWHAGGLNVMLLAKPAPWTDRYWFERVLAEIAPVD